MRQQFFSSINESDLLNTIRQEHLALCTLLSLCLHDSRRAWKENIPACKCATHKKELLVKLFHHHMKKPTQGEEKAVLPSKQVEE